MWTMCTDRTPCPAVSMLSASVKSVHANAKPDWSASCIFSRDLCIEASAVQGESHLQAASPTQDTELLYYIIARSKLVKRHGESKAAEVTGASYCDFEIQTLGEMMTL